MRTLRINRTIRTRLLTFATIAAIATLPPLAAPSGGNIVFILDGSGSMWAQLEGKTKIAIAKEVLGGLIKDLPAGIEVGLVAYGHRAKGDCNDVEELVPLGPPDTADLIADLEQALEAI